MYRYLFIVVLMIALSALSVAYISLSENCSDEIKRLKTEYEVVDIKAD